MATKPILEAHLPADYKRLDEMVVEPVVKFPPNRWRDLEKEADKKKRHFSKHKTTRPWVEHRELRGVAAEEIVSVFTGLPRHKSFTDGGEDFFRSDVKGVPPRKPVLAVVPVDGNGGPIRWVARYYICVVVDVREHWGAILGHATREQVRDARLVKMLHSHAHVVYPWELTPGLPDELVEYSRLMKAAR